METPGIWSENIVRNFERIIEWSEAVKLMCEITTHDFEYYVNKMTFKIKDDNLQSSIQNHGFNFGFILKWIYLGINSINANPRLPGLCNIDENIDYKKYDALWKKHINNERQVLDELCKSVTNLMILSKEKVKTFYDEISDAYSSYSDYSEDTTSSEEEEDAPDDEEDEEDEEEDEEEEDEEYEEEEDKEEEKTNERDHDRNRRKNKR